MAKTVVGILVAEDDPAVQSFICRALTQNGYEVSAVDDGLAALEALRSRSFDLLVADIVMPGLDGIGLALKVTRELPDLPILLVTGYALEHERARNLHELISEVISKPFTLQQICQAAETAIANGAGDRNLHL